MENTTRLLERQCDELADRKWALVNANDAAAPSLSGCVYSHADRPVAAGVDVAMLPTLPHGVDLVVLLLPKSLENLEFLLAALAGQLDQACELWLVGPTRGGIKGGMTRLSRYASQVRSLDSARHCKLVSAMLSPQPFSLSAWTRTFSARRGAQPAVEVTSYPGVFNHGTLDEGTALLLDAMADVAAPQTVLDVGCGAGVISAVMAAAGSGVTALDVSATAVAATQATLAANQLAGTVLQSDLYDAVTPGAQFNWLVTNPPFHDGSERTLGITRRLIESAPQLLLPGGQLWLVANQGLAYHDWLEKAFARVIVAAENRRFRVYRAWH